MLRGLSLNTEIEVIAQALWYGDALFAPDGSVKDDTGTFSFALGIHLLSKPYTLAAVAHGHMPPIADGIKMDSHRPEGAALYAVLSWIQTTLTNYPRLGPAPQHQKHISIVIDNKSVTQDAYDTMDDDTSVYKYLRPDYDITQGIHSLIASLPVPVTISWVKGHQDLHTPWEELTTSAQLNVIADSVCSDAYASDFPLTGRFPDHIPGTTAILRHHGLNVTKGSDKYVRSRTHAQEIIKYSIARSDSRLRDRTTPWTTDIFHNIDWDCFELQFKALTPAHRLRITKFIHDWTPTLHHQSRFDNTINNCCFDTDCKHLPEDAKHILRCIGPTRCVIRETHLTTLRSLYQTLFTPPDMANVIINALRAWMKSSPIAPLPWQHPHSTTLQKATKRAYTAQSRIGWDQFFCGRLSKYWRLPLIIYHRERRPITHATPTIWLSKTIKAMWDLFTAMWTQRNMDFHGGTPEAIRDKALTATRTTVQRVYTQSQGNISQHQSRILHRLPVIEILKWTKSHLDAYLATAHIFLDKNIEPG